jgi:hypothetical protein
MKKIISASLAFILIFATLLSAVSCGKKEKYKDYGVASLYFSLPENMKPTIASGHHAYENREDGTKVRVYSYVISDIASEYGEEGVTPKSFLDRYAKKNSITYISESYDEEKKTASVTYTDKDGGYNFDLVLSDESMLYHVNMSAAEENREKYEKEFAKWAKKIKIEENFVYYSESGLNFALPASMKKINVSYADICFSNNDNAEFFVYFYSSEGLQTEYYLAPDATVKEYWDTFAVLWGYENVEENYEEDKKKITLKYVYDELGENLFFNDVIMRNTDSLIHVTMCAPGEKRATYEPIFDKWAEKLSLVYK